MGVSAYVKNVSFFLMSLMILSTSIEEAAHLPHPDPQACSDLNDL
jgi:hypothetical protein